MYKIVIAILLLGGLSATAEDCVRVDTFDTGNASSFGGAIISQQEIADWLGDSLQIWTPKRDTTHYYIKEIKQKCDTTGWLMCAVYNCNCRGWPHVSCVDDTVWAEKVQVWLTPTQLKELMRIIDATGGASTKLPSIYHKKLKE
ncbi:hypothetical protein LCGC14_2799700 [marine sediment metagenome]|uniref:Uncharacterized protein n=1 Tax=marine sediment metagenome TaxID=412755 RepID=A0A0F8YN10_9ZZZZ